MDKPYVFPGSAELLALGLYNITVQLSSLVSDGPWDVLIICRGLEQHFLAGA